ncbi:MAG: biotin--[acetyl-CoA-carboxylase] ligase [Rhodospirillales bacterium RIFCSPLOWO2_12_FULL_58_28]|nr:MAG: biotin--[acetyl-CoA-carboxylase] ligase [Rhodospirillales bacterium RIFCSPLOWO2_02_FULL_58_16]OHC79052.1 MAG: biotin--[acetyl-CoA-carboxylase] ligase [Rhodospirillales bacterium RIFCSPLOWO2_12_FULL_58_28]
MAGLPDFFRLTALDRVDGTNAEAKRMAESGAAEGAVVMAMEQSAGRGRQGRSWQSPPGNLYCSILLRPDYPASMAMQLTFVAAVSLAEAVAAALPQGTVVTCKWPNDILVEGRKVAGILLETSSVGITGMLEWLVVGVGVNIARHPADVEFPATSLCAEGAADIAPAALLAGFCRCFLSSMTTWRSLGFAAVRAAWLKRAYGLGEAIEVRLAGETLRGSFQTIDKNGALVLRRNGQERRITAGDVFMSGETDAAGY